LNALAGLPFLIGHFAGGSLEKTAIVCGGLLLLVQGIVSLSP
jgi:hypothetical protein